MNTETLAQENDNIRDFFKEYYSGFGCYSPEERKKMPLSYTNYVSDEFVYRDVCRAFVKDMRFTTLADKQVLDVGCGNGRVLRWMLDLGAVPTNMFGVDASPIIIEEAKRLSCSDISFHAGMGNELPFQDNRFDLLMNFGVIIHILNDDTIRDISREFRRVIKPNGFLVLVVSNEDVIYKDNWMKQRVRSFDRKKNEIEGLFSQWTVAQRYDGYPESFTSLITLLANHTTDPKVKESILKRGTDDNFTMSVNNDLELLKICRTHGGGGKSIYIMKPKV